MTPKFFELTFDQLEKLRKLPPNSKKHLEEFCREILKATPYASPISKTVEPFLFSFTNTVIAAKIFENILSFSTIAVPVFFFVLCYKSCSKKSFFAFSFKGFIIFFSLIGLTK